MCMPTGTESCHKLFFLSIWSPIHLPKKGRVKHNKYYCPVWLLTHKRECAHEVRHRFPLPPPSSTRGSRRTVPAQQAQDSGQSWQDKRGTMIYRHKCGRVEGGAWGEHLPPSVSIKYTKKASTQTNPHPTSRALHSFSHEHTFSISSCSVCMYSSSPCRVLHKPIRWIRPL